MHPSAYTVLDRLTDKTLSIDELILRTGQSRQDVCTNLLFLEVRGLVRQLEGKRFKLTEKGKKDYCRFEFSNGSRCMKEIKRGETLCKECAEHYEAMDPDNQLRFAADGCC